MYLVLSRGSFIFMSFVFVYVSIHQRWGGAAPLKFSSQMSAFSFSTRTFRYITTHRSEQKHHGFPNALKVDLVSKRNNHFQNSKSEFSIWISFSPWNSGAVISLSFMGHNFVPRSSIVSFWSNRCVCILTHNRALPGRHYTFDTLKKHRGSTSSMFTFVIGMNFPMFRFERFSAR